MTIVLTTCDCEASEALTSQRCTNNLGKVLRQLQTLFRPGIFSIEFDVHVINGNKGQL